MMARPVPVGPQGTRTSTQIRRRARPHGRRRRKWKKPAGGSSERGKKKIALRRGLFLPYSHATPRHATHDADAIILCHSSGKGGDMDCLLPAPVGSGRRARTNRYVRLFHSPRRPMRPCHTPRACTYGGCGSGRRCRRRCSRQTAGRPAASGWVGRVLRCRTDGPLHSLARSLLLFHR